jgi:hypothetical protein
VIPTAEKQNAYEILVGKNLKKQLGRASGRWEDIIWVDLQRNKTCEFEFIRTRIQIDGSLT